MSGTVEALRAALEKIKCMPEACCTDNEDWNEGYEQARFQAVHVASKALESEEGTGAAPGMLAALRTAEASLKNSVRNGEGGMARDLSLETVQAAIAAATKEAS